ncbi:MAG TPA: hypothetical protein VIN34_06365 [Candidatus Limnocylindria bacterium]|jgi:hypothetical protein
MDRRSQRTSAWLVVLLVLVALGRPGPIVIALGGDGPIMACGSVRAYTPATSTFDGSLTIGTRTYSLGADDVYRRQAERNGTYVVGRPTCLTGTLAAGRVDQYSAIGFPDQLCGTVIAFRAPTAGTAGSVTLRLGEATLVIPSGSDAGPAPAVASRACFTLALDAFGDAVASGRVLTIADRTASLVSVCGTVSAWTRPPMTTPGTATHQTDGAITVGTHRFVIAAGTAYSTVNAFPVVGQPTCLLGSLDRAGRLIQYGAQPGLPDCIGGPVNLVRPTATASGSVRFVLPAVATYTADSHRFAISAGTALPPDADNGTYCFTLALGSDGDAVATGVRSVPIASMPSTSTQ